MSTTPECSWPTCQKPAKSARGGLCGMHRERQRAGSPPMDAPPKFKRGSALAEKYRVTESGCWEWVNSVVTAGYGQLNGRRAHRVVWEMHRGLVPEGLVLDHLCRNRACVNPDHLEPVTVAENNRRGMHPNYVAWREGRCTKGHEYTPENTRHEPNGTRACKRCHADREAARKARLRGAVA